MGADIVNRFTDLYKYDLPLNNATMSARSAPSSSTHLSLSNIPDISLVEQTRQFLLSVARAMRVCAESPDHESAAHGFAEAIGSAIPKSPPAATIKASTELRKAQDTRLARRLIELGDHLPWTESPRTPDMGNKIAVCSFNDLFDLKHHTAGLLYLDPELAYPEHRHPPPELYLTLSGTGSWRYGGSTEYRVVSAGNLLYNHPLDLHGVRSSETPLLALFLLWHNETD